MAGKTRSKPGALLLAMTFALAMFGAHTWAQLLVLSGATVSCLLYWQSGWVTKRGLTIPERMGHSAALLLVVSCVTALYTWQFRPGWHLTSAQEDGMAEVARNIPKGVVLLVELPENSIAGQEYGKEIMRVFKENGAKVNSITVFQGAGETPVGLLVSARYRGDLGYQMAGYVHSRMVFLKMPAKFQEGNPTAEATSFIIYVGSRPSDD